jgi:hypothetical protein
VHGPSHHRALKACTAQPPPFPCCVSTISYSWVECKNVEWDTLERCVFYYTGNHESYIIVPHKGVCYVPLIWNGDQTCAGFSHSSQRRSDMVRRLQDHLCVGSKHTNDGLQSTFTYKSGWHRWKCANAVTLWDLHSGPRSHHYAHDPRLRLLHIWARI